MRFFSWFVLSVFTTNFLSLPACFAGRNFRLTAQAALVVDNEKGRIIFKKNTQLKLPAASTAKILSAIIVIEHLSFEDKVKISKEAARVAPSKASLSENATYSVEDLLKALLISSANDAGTALAEAVCNSENRFAQLMNQKAKTLGAKNSFFLNATGLPEGKKKQYSTVYDLSLFMQKILSYPQLVKIMQIKKTTICGSDGKQIPLYNHNKFLWRKTNYLIGKTGYTCKAKHCFLGTFSKGKNSFIVAIQGSRKPWSDLEYLINKRY